MAAWKLLVFVVFLSLTLTNIRVEADASISDDDGEVKVSRSGDLDGSVIEKLNSKIVALESLVDQKTKEAKGKDEVIVAKEKIIAERLENIASLESEIAALQKKGKKDAAEQVGKAHARASELELLVEKLREEANLKYKEKEQLEVRVAEAEKKSSDVDSKLESLQKIIDDQKAKLRKTERALHIAEEEMMKAKLEATSKVKELTEVHGAWLPPWLAVHYNKYRSLLDENWQAHGKPALETLKHKAIEKKAQAEEWAAPHMETVKTKWVPAIKEQWVVIATNVEPHVQTLTTKTVEFYEVSKDAIKPHIIKVRKVADPYIQELRKQSRPYIDQVAAAARPHVDKIRTTLKPYTQQVVHVSGKFLESATVYHNQVQDKVHEKLKSHELTKPLATKELVWFSASAILALPIIFLLKMCSAAFGKKAKKPSRSGNATHSRRKKRVHPDK
ncbi:uncharacterized protein LOC127265579 [Andrographis paniculata]|uniref:uncharacterized protein LOC127265579 n=1 Tax=Andrographis paniculata TaxID=175694 RepID=UPI0021E70BCA|nr:uncharacterized protein LOC127265579 [Andrographis paniculata]